VNQSFKKLLTVPIAVLILLISASSVKAQTTFNVNSTIDAIDANPGNSICEIASGNGICTLRAAIQEANTQSGSSLILIPLGNYTLSIPGDNENLAASGDLDISKPITITGEGSGVTVIDANRIDRIFDIQSSSSNVAINGVTIQRGNVGSGQRGGGVLANANLVISNSIIQQNSVSGAEAYYSMPFGGGISSSKALTIINSTVGYNSASGQGSSGGGIYMDLNSSLIIQNSTIVGNSTTVDSHTGSDGGGIYSKASVIIEQSTITGNVSSHGSTAGSMGGGMYISGGPLTITESTIKNNSSRNGAGLVISGNVTIVKSTFYNNHAEVGGGGIQAGGGNLTIDNSTFSNNAAGLPNFGGGIGFYGDGQLLITNSTFAENRSNSLFLDRPNHVTIRNTILSTTSYPNCYLAGSTQVVSQGYNLISDNTCNLSGVGDRQGTTPLIGFFQDNGGPTFTHELLTGSPAIDSGDPINCPLNRSARSHTPTRG